MFGGWAASQPSLTLSVPLQCVRDVLRLRDRRRLGGIVLAALPPSDLGWIGGCSEAVGLALVLFRGGQKRLGPHKFPVDWGFKSFPALGIWSKDSGARGTPSAGFSGDARYARPFFVPNSQFVRLDA